MGSLRKKVKTVGAKEDRISNLPDELIHQILSHIDATDAVQTSLISTRWRNLWKSLFHANFDSCYFARISDFSKFVAKFLHNRDNNSDLSVFNQRSTFYSRGSITRTLVSKIAIYGAMHNLQHLRLSTNVCELPLSVFTIKTLKQLSLTSPRNKSTFKLKSPLNLPALIALSFHRVLFESSMIDGTSKSVNLFSKLLNLKTLALLDCETKGLEVFNINSPQLENLHLEFFQTPPCEIVFSAPKLSFFKYEGYTPLPISSSDLSCLVKVYLDIDIRNCKYKKRFYMEISNLFHQLRYAKFVTLTLGTISAISWIFELLENQPSPFCKMECLKIEQVKYWLRDSTFSTGLLTYLCNSSPKATIFNELSSRFFPGP